MQKTVWGRWTLNEVNACLEITISENTGAVYQIALEELNTAAATLDWIYQIREKSWATSEDKSDLLDAIVDIFGRGVAGGGKPTEIDTKRILADRYGIHF